MKPKIYTFNCESWIGNLGKNSEKVQQPKCEVCNRIILEEIKFSKVELEIDKYNGEDMVSAFGLIIVTENLYKALLGAGIKGFAPLKVSKIKFEYADVDMEKIPTLIYLAILSPSPAVRNIPIASDFTGICENCKQYQNQYNEEKSKLIRRSTTENAIHLQVYFDSYDGADIFNFADHGEVGVTEKFLDVIKDFNCPDNIIIPADWI